MTLLGNNIISMNEFSAFPVIPCHVLDPGSLCIVLYSQITLKMLPWFDAFISLTLVPSLSLKDDHNLLHCLHHPEACIWRVSLESCIYVVLVHFPPGK